VIDAALRHLAAAGLLLLTVAIALELVDLAARALRGRR